MMPEHLQSERKRRKIMNRDVKKWRKKRKNSAQTANPNETRENIHMWQREIFFP